MLFRKLCAFAVLGLWVWPPATLCGQSGVVDASTLTGKCLLGYQAWHACGGDGKVLDGYIHWSHLNRVMPSPTDVVCDIWPDLSEFGSSELFATGFTLGNGQPAKAYSCYLTNTVLRHFRWLRDYGLDGVVFQRFTKDVFIDSTWSRAQKHQPRQLPPWRRNLRPGLLPHVRHLERGPGAGAEPLAERLGLCDRDAAPHQQRALLEASGQTAAGNLGSGLFRRPGGHADHRANHHQLFPHSRLHGFGGRANVLAHAHGRFPNQHRLGGGVSLLRCVKPLDRRPLHDGRASRQLQDRHAHSRPGRMPDPMA